MLSGFAFGTSLLSLLLSAWVAYTAHLGSAQPSLSLGRKLFFYPLPRFTSNDIVWGGVGFYIPITFFNRGPKGCSIIEVRMVIESKSDPTRCFDLSWSEFAGISTDDETLLRSWQTNRIAQPISLEGHSSVSKTVQFAWDPRTNESLDLSRGRYELRILAWTNDSAEADIKVELPFQITKSQENEFKKNQSEQHPLTVEVPLGESKRDNNVVTRDEVRRLYG